MCIHTAEIGLPGWEAQIMKPHGFTSRLPVPDFQSNTDLLVLDRIH